MNRLHHDDDQFKTITDASGRRIRVARDGAVIHVPLMMMDSIQRAVASATLDARLRNLGDPRDKRFNLDEARRIRDAAYELRESEDTNAWRYSGDVRQQQCQDDQRQQDALDPYGPRFNLDAARAAREQAYLDYDRMQENAWRGKENPWREPR